MVSIINLLIWEKDLIEKLEEISIKIAEDTYARKKVEADLWCTLPFKELGATNDKMRAQVVLNRMQQTFPTPSGTDKAKMTALENKLKFVRQVISVMESFGVNEIDLKEKKEEDQDKK